VVRFKLRKEVTEAHSPGLLAVNVYELVLVVDHAPPGRAHNLVDSKSTFANLARL